MMNHKSTFVLSALIIILARVSVVASSPVTDEYKHGPRSDELLMKFFADVEGAYGALKAGAIDMVMYDITYQQYLDAVEDENIQLAPVEEIGMYEVDINNNYTIATYPGVRSMTHSVDFRLAMAHLLDKSYVVIDCCRGFATRIDVPAAAPTDVSWINTSVVEEWGGVYYGNYPYPYDPWAAQSLLDDAGFMVGSTPNPAYDPDVPWSQPNLRTYPSDWDGKAGEDLDPLYCAIRNDDSRRLCMGRFLADNLLLSGVPCDKSEGGWSRHYGRVMGAFDYHFYTGGWSLGRCPLDQYNLYHSDFWYRWAPNYVTGVNKTGHPNYPDLDAVLEEIYYCPDMAASMAASRKAQGLFVEKYCICLWTFTAKSYWAYRNLLGVVNMDGYGLDNDHTFMNMKTADGTRPTIGIITPPYQQNVLISSWPQDRQVMDRYYGAPADISVAPYSLTRDQPWVIQDWTPMTWLDPEDGKNKTKVAMWFRENVKWVSPVTGDVYGNFTAHDFAFSEYFTAAYKKTWTHDDKENIHHIKIIDDYCIEIFMEKDSYWLQYVGDYVVNKALWQDKFCMINTTIVTLLQDYHFCDKLWLRPYITTVEPGCGTGQILEVVDCTLDGEHLVEHSDYDIVMLGDDHTYFHWRRNALAGQELVVTYWTPDPSKPSPDGFWPGDYPWDEITVGIGTHYVVDCLRSDFFALKANRHFWLETPVPDPNQSLEERCNPMPAEVDWIWEWDPRDPDRPSPNDPRGPRRGNYVVDIADVVLCTAAWKSRGNDSPPNPRWRAGADLALPECFIDISDLVSITGRYRRKFGGWTQALSCP